MKSSTSFYWQTVDGIQIHVKKWLPNVFVRAVIVVVHGLGEHAGRYQFLAEILVKSGYAVIAFDLRGHGLSSGQRGHAPSYSVLLDDISCCLAFAQKSYPSLPCFLYGHSFGGNLVLNYVLHRQPELQGVIVTSPSLRTAFQPPAWKMYLGKVMYHVLPRLSFANGIKREHLCRDSVLIEQHFQDRALMHNKVTARLGIDILNSGLWALQHAGEFSLPLLLMHGAEDKVTSADASREFAHAIGTPCTLKIWEGFYHEIHHEPERDKVYSFLLDWLAHHFMGHQDK